MAWVRFGRALLIPGAARGRLSRGEDSSIEKAESGPPSILEIVKQFAAYTAVLYAVGFLAMRSRLAVLGVWSSIPLTDDRFLHEGGVFVLYTAERLLYPWAFIAFCLAGLVLFTLGMKKEWADAVRGVRFHRSVEVAFFVVAAVVLTKVIQTHCNGANVALGALLPQGTKGVGAAVLEELRAAGDAGVISRYDRLLFIAVSAVALFRLALGTSWLGRAPSWVTVYTGLLALLSVLALPVNYGVWISSRYFPIARVVANPALGSDTVLVLSDTEKELVVCSKRKIVSVARDQVQSLEVTHYGNVFDPAPEGCQ